MAPSTRKVYIEYQRTFRQLVPDGVLIKEWNLMSVAQRTEWVNTFNNIQRLRADGDARAAAGSEAHVASNAAHVEFAAVQAMQVAGREDLQRFLDVLDRAVRFWTGIKGIRQREHDAWLKLRRQESDHRGHSAASLRRATTQVQGVVLLLQAVEQELAPLETLRDRPPVPADSDGLHRLPDVLTTRNRIKFARKTGLRAHLLAGGHGPVVAGQWRPQRELAGGMSVAWVWLQFDAHDNIIDRVVRKKVYLEEERWVDPRKWEGDVRDYNAKTPWEIVCHEALDRMTNFRNVAQVRVHLDANRTAIDNDSLSYRLILQWCEYQDLHYLIDGYRLRGEQIPEPFLWCVLECLADACVAMHWGDMNNEVEDWTNIIHRQVAFAKLLISVLTMIYRDLKPANIFLDSTGDPRYPTYPKPVVADLGLAIRVKQDDPNNPRYYNSRSGTRGFLPPEQRRFFDNEADALTPVREVALTEKTNIYGVGLILWCMIARNLTPGEPWWLGEIDSDTTLNWPAAAPYEYSATLLDLVGECLCFNPDARPSPQVLRDRVAAEVSEAAGAPNRAAWTRSGNFANALKAASIHQSRIVLPRNAYQIGLARAHIVD